MTLPQDDLPVVERDVVRLVVRDVDDRILLFHTREAMAPELGEWWELPGGGIEAGETYREAAVRELYEETGIVVGGDQVGAPNWTRDGTFRHAGARRLQHEVVVEVRLAGPGPDIDPAGRMDDEKEAYFDFRWWPVAEVVASTGLFYPRRLPELLGPFLDGETISEPLEVWA